MNKYDEKQRPEVGFKDMKNHEFGGVEVEELLTNGYTLYIPYGIHCEIFDAIKDSVRIMGKYQADLERYCHETEEEILKSNFRHQIKEIDKHIEVLQRISPIVHEI